MRKTWAVVALAAGVVIGYVLRPLPAVAQTGDFQPFTTGQTVHLTVESFPGITTIVCRVGSVSGDFIQCAGDGQRRPRAVNLRYVQQITPLPER